MMSVVSLATQTLVVQIVPIIGNECEWKDIGIKKSINGQAEVGGK